MSGESRIDASGIGGTIASRVAAHLAKAVTTAKVELGPHQASVVQRILADFTNHVSDEVRGAMGPLWMTIAESPDSAPWLRELARSLGQERGQAWAWIAGTATSAAMGGGLMSLLTNELQPTVGALIRANPNMPFAPADAALIESRGTWSGPDLWTDAAQFGLNRDRFNALVAVQHAVLTPVDILTLIARGEISEKQAGEYLSRAGWDPHHAQVLLSLAPNHVSVQDAAQMFNRSIVDMEEVERLARKGGYSPEVAKWYAELAGQPLPIQDAMTALRRGIITTDQARRAWIQGPVRNEWFDAAEKLQYSPMSTVDAADAVNQGHMSLDEGRQIAEWNGLMGEHFDTLIEIAGLPPGVELATEALNRGLLTEEQFRTAFLESRLKNRYVDLYMKLRWRVMPPETVRRIYRDGGFTKEQAIERLQWAGYSPEDAAAQLAAEHSDASAADRELTKSEVLALYSDRGISEAEAKDWLSALGYSEESIGLQLILADLRRVRRYSDAVANRVRAAYVAGRTTYDEVVGILDSLRVPAEQREEMISLWDLERQATTKGLTVAQVQAATKRGLLSPAEASAELTAQGYSERDASILLALATPAARA